MLLQLCVSLMSKPLHIVFKNYLENECFPKEWKKATIVSVYKKSNKQLISDYRPVSLLQIGAKIFEKIIFNSPFK